MSFILRKANGTGDPIEVTAQGLARHLAHPSRDFGKLLFELGYNILPVELKDGPATVQRHIQPPQPQLPLEPSSIEPPVQPFVAKAWLHLRVIATIACPGRTEDDVKDTIRGVVRGFRGLPRGFQLSINPDDAETIFNALENSQLDVIDDVDFGEVLPRRLQIAGPGGGA